MTGGRGRRVDLEPAYLLHQRDWRDSSRILELYTRDHGRVALFAKGARRPGSGLAAVLRPFVPLRVTWSGSADGGTLIAAEATDLTRGVAPACLMSAFYLNELLLKLLAREDPFPELFAAYGDAIGALATADGEAVALRLFEKRLLDALGLGVDYAQCVGGGDSVRPDRYYHVDPRRGVVAAVAAQAPDAVSGADLLALAAEDLSGARLGGVRGLLRAALDQALDGRELNSRRVARAVKARPPMP